jgi:hypothetical protein
MVSRLWQIDTDGFRNSLVLWYNAPKVTAGFTAQTLCRWNLAASRKRGLGCV